MTRTLVAIGLAALAAAVPGIGLEGQVAGGGASLPCPGRAGVRSERSSVLQGGSARAWIDTRAETADGTCTRSATLHVEAPGATKSYDLPNATRDTFTIRDFSPDGSALLLERRTSEDWFGNVEIAELAIGADQLHWHDLWNLLALPQCDADLTTRGFTPDGRVLVWIGPAREDHHPHPNCVSDDGAYTIDLASSAVTRMTYQPDAESHAEQLADATRPCKSDPDVFGACFVVHGRLTGPYNGDPTFRIWRIGTHRMLGVYDSFVPWGLFDLPEPTSLEVNAFGDYTLSLIHI